MSADRVRPHGAVRTAVILDVLTAAVAELAARIDTITVLDVGGGTGGVAVPLAELGHQVVVVDPSPDSLAALERRAAETGMSGLVTGQQGDATELVSLLGPDSVDVVICHSVLEVVDDPADALAEVAAVLRPGGLASILVANRVAAVVARVASGRLAEARHLLADPAGSAGATDPLTRRFTLDQVAGLVTDAGLQLRVAHGIRVFADAAPAALLDIDPQAAADLLALERDAAEDPAYAAVATQLHLLAERR
jgi:SAM-dependent methyltransferase